MLETPQGRLSVRLLDQAVHVARLWGGPDFRTDSYYLRTPTDWAYLDTLIAPLPELCLVFPDGEMDRVLCNSLTLTAADGTSPRTGAITIMEKAACRRCSCCFPCRWPGRTP